MKTIITSTGNQLDSQFDLRFGRAGWFCVYDNETKTTNFVENGFKNVNGGAGTKTSEMAAELGAKKVISGHFGPKAKDLLERLSIQMVTLEDEELNVEDIISKLENN
jgi:predicted Fe-Mo cluster-binding NifX family protein